MSTPSPACSAKTFSNADLSSRGTTRFHLSLNVGDLTRSIEFFRILLGCVPAKCRDDYAKFEIDDPPLALSLEPCSFSPGGALNHLGFRMCDSEALVDVQRRLETAGISTRREEGVECCYARQTKFWVHDPDGNMWEVYTLDEDLEHRGDGRLPVIDANRPENDDKRNGPALSVWSHRLGEAFPKKLPILDRTVDRVMLQGTFNERLDREEAERRLQEVRRVLKAGGLVQLHMLTSNKPTGDVPPRLPGPAAKVETVPVESEMLSLLTQAGFANPRIDFRGASPCFMLGDCELRETRLEAEAPPG
jgi:catechol 2,3-dioxygenase-like lactoylglutathione lyase family enzyme